MHSLKVKQETICYTLKKSSYMQRRILLKTILFAKSPKLFILSLLYNFELSWISTSSLLSKPLQCQHGALLCKYSFWARGLSEGSFLNKKQVLSQLLAKLLQAQHIALASCSSSQLALALLQVARCPWPKPCSKQQKTLSRLPCWSALYRRLAASII